MVNYRYKPHACEVFGRQCGDHVPGPGFHQGPRQLTLERRARRASSP
jgi:hypothetical protein